MLSGLRRRIEGYPATVVAGAFALYALIITLHSLYAWRQMVEDAERYLVEDVDRSVIELANLVARFEADNGMHADIYEIQAFLQNRDLGMSMRYGLGASLQAIERRFESHLEEHASDQRILYYASDGGMLVDTAPDSPVPEGVVDRIGKVSAGVWLDVSRKQVVAIRSVRYKNASGGVVVSIDSLEHILKPMMLADAKPWRELVLDATTRHWLIPDEPSGMQGMLRAIESLEQGAVAVTDGVLASWLDREQAVVVRRGVSDLGLQLVKVMPAELVYGHIPALDVLLAAAALPLVMVWGAHRLDRIRLSAERLKTEVALSNQRRQLVEQRNEELSQEIERREQVEQALTTSEERWSLAISGANDGIWDWRPLTGETFFSERWKKLLGYQDDEIAADFEERDRRIHPDDWVMVMRRMQKHLDGATRFYQCEYRMRQKDGDYIWVLERGQALHDEQGNTLRVTGSMTDISERRRAEALLEERNVQLNTIFEISPDGMVSFGHGHRVEYVNPAFLRMTHLELSDVRGLGESEFDALMNELCADGQRFRGIAAMHDHPLPGKQRETLGLKGAGERILAVQLVVSKSETISRILFFRDITVESEVDRMKSEFVSTAAHELRTPLASIYGYAELLVAESQVESRPRLFAETIFREAALVASIIDELLDLARIESRRGADFVFKRQALGQLVATAVAAYPVPEGRAAPILKSAGQPCWVRADASKLRQCLNNILSNAYKYSPAGGAIEVELTFGQGDCGVSVRDRGIGMSSEQLDRVFERFYRADSAGTIPGTGLGMSIVKEIIDLHGGRVTVESRMGEGTAVLLRLPMIDADVSTQDLVAVPLLSVHH